MGQYLIQKFKGKYRLRTELDQSTNDFQREYDNSLSYNDVYVDCAKGTKIFHYGRDILEVYFSKRNVARNVIKSIISDDLLARYSTVSNTTLNGLEKEITSIDWELLYKDISNSDEYPMYNIRENDEELEFYIKYKDIDSIIDKLLPKTSCADRSPMSTKNLPKSPYTIPEHDELKYKKITKNIQLKDGLLINGLNKDFINKIGKKLKIDVNKDMRSKCMKAKQYIHSLGYWNDYCTYLQKELTKVGKGA